MTYLIIPGSDIVIYDGTVVLLARFPGVRWIVHNGDYVYNNEDYTGWYFSAIPSEATLPMNEIDLRTAVVVSKSCPCLLEPRPFPPRPTPQPPLPPGPFDPTVPFKKSQRDAVYAAFITVTTLADRDELDTSVFPDGKLIRVNDADGQLKYYAWNASTKEWEDAQFSQDLSNYLTKTEAAETYATKEELDASAVRWVPFNPDLDPDPDPDPSM